jgi:hypothetical protein
MAGPHQTSRQRLDCVCLSTALRRTAMIPRFETAAIPISESGLKKAIGRIADKSQIINHQS